MKITRRQLRQIIKEELQYCLKESSREGHWHDAGYEDGSDGSDPKYMNNMAYMDGYETGVEDHEYDKKLDKEMTVKKRELADAEHDWDDWSAGDTGSVKSDYPAILGYTDPETGKIRMINVQTYDDMDDILDPLLKQYPELKYSID